jgi:hypothetical protein
MSSGAPLPLPHPPLGPAARRWIALCFLVLLALDLAALSGTILRRREIASAAVRLGTAEHQAAVLQTARVLDQNDDVAALVAEALLDEREEAESPEERVASAARAKELLLGAMASRPGAAHDRFLLGRSAPEGEGESRFWERPLELAIRGAPGLDMAPERLAAIYLARWPTLGPDQRARAATVLRRAFADPAFVGKQFPAASAALGPEIAVSMLPDDPEVLRVALRLSAESGGGPHVEILRARLKNAPVGGGAPESTNPGS